ncbi:MAG TPA: Rap1a/Tai family immunity protein [Steroidobacteraceae bacterium]|nr:Rap1a/Tai family immunity protein [Steroidobacteraceae bacterium]
MQVRIVFLAVLACLWCGHSLAAPPNVETLLKECADKTIVVNRDAKKVGERLGGYCAAYLEATLDATKNVQPTLCDNAENRAPEYLLSVFQTYLQDAKVDKTTQASKALIAAYRRAFACSASQK